MRYKLWIFTGMLFVLSGCNQQGPARDNAVNLPDRVNRESSANRNALDTTLPQPNESDEGNRNAAGVDLSEVKKVQQEISDMNTSVQGLDEKVEL